MNILGVGGWELLAILVIMLLVAGPKRMLHWAYILGTYVAKFRVMWSETVDVIQKEFDDAGVDIKIPKDPPTRARLNQQAGRALESLTRPVKTTMDEAAGQMGQIKEATAITARTAASTVNGNGHAPRQKPKPPRPSAASSTIQPQVDNKEFGTWSGQASAEGRGDLGTWSAGGTHKNDQPEA